MRVLAFVGPSGTGKSYRAQLVARENNIHYIIDDGLLINENEVLAGTSAKKAPTKIETVKHALFIEEKEQADMKKASQDIKKHNIAKNIDINNLEKNVNIFENQHNQYLEFKKTKEALTTYYQKRNEELQNKVKELIQKAQKSNRIKPLSEAFKKNPIKEEVHKGKINSYR